ncbi:transcriptional repressor NrdR [Candidatus Woesearchaeota archaeon]|nr:transcriptional repressor NrdR [Candidatus Woesearchaeota archaeon]
MKCPYCTSTENKVVDKRETPEGSSTRRRRECYQCRKRFTTYEHVEMADLYVVKKDGAREPFDRNKIKRGLLKACEKRPLGPEQIEQLIDEVEAEFRNREIAEINSKEIGEVLMNKLKKMDKVAYIRFASVYRDFEDITDFEKELNELLRKRTGK